MGVSGPLSQMFEKEANDCRSCPTSVTWEAGVMRNQGPSATRHLLHFGLQREDISNFGASASFEELLNSRHMLFWNSWFVFLKISLSIFFISIFSICIQIVIVAS